MILKRPLFASKSRDAVYNPGAYDRRVSFEVRSAGFMKMCMPGEATNLYRNIVANCLAWQLVVAESLIRREHA